MKQTSFFPPSSKKNRVHGGELALNKRRTRRSLNIKEPVHLVLRSDLAKGPRSLIHNQKIVQRVLLKYARRFRIRVYEKAICGNHIHCLVKAQTRRELQYFFRVFAGQVAQEILKEHPLQKHEKKAFTGGTPAGAAMGGGRAGKGGERTMHPKNQRTFWSFLCYTRLVSWGREFRAVKAYVVLNIKEALGLVSFKIRGRRLGWVRRGAG